MNKKLLILLIASLAGGISAMEDDQSPKNQWLTELKAVKEKCWQETATHQEVEEFFNKEILDLRKLIEDAYQIAHCRGFYPYHQELDNESTLASLYFAKKAFEVAKEKAFDLGSVHTNYSGYVQTTLENITQCYNELYAKYHPTIWNLGVFKNWFSNRQ